MTLNLLVYTSGYNDRVLITEARTKKGKPRCQMLSSTWRHVAQCDRPASFYEPAHEKFHKRGNVRPIYRYEDGQAEAVYPDTTLFGYCRIHSATLHNEELERIYAEHKAFEEQIKARKAHESQLDKNFATMLEAVRDGDIGRAQQIVADFDKDNFTPKLRH